MRWMGLFSHVGVNKALVPPNRIYFIIWYYIRHTVYSVIPGGWVCCWVYNWQIKQQGAIIVQCVRVFVLNYLFCFFKAIEDEGGDPENFKTQPPTDASIRKGGKAKGNLVLI